MIKGQPIIGGRKAATAVPTLYVKKHGRIILNRAAAEFVQPLGDRVKLWWDRETSTLTVQASTDDDTLKLAINGVPGFSAKQKLQVIGWDFSKAQGPIEGSFLEADKAMEFKIPPECLGATS